MAQRDPAHKGSCKHGQTANFDFSGSSKGPWLCLNWARWIWLQTHAFKKPELPAAQLCHGWELTYAPSQRSMHACAPVGTNSVQSLIWFHTETLSIGKIPYLKCQAACLSSRFAWVSTAGLSLSCAAKQFLLVANQFCPPSIGTGDVYYLFSGPWRSCKLFFPPSVWFSVCLFLRKSYL